MSRFNLWASLWATVSRWLTQATSNLSRTGLRSWSLGALKTVSFCQKPQWILMFPHKAPNWCNSKTCFSVSPKLHRQDESLTLVCPLSAIVKAPPSGNRKCQVLFFYRDFIRATWSLVSVIFGDVKLQRFWVYVKGRGRGSMPTFEYSPQDRILCISAVHCPVWRNLRGSIRSHLCCHLVDTEISSNLAEILIGGSNLLKFFFNH